MKVVGVGSVGTLCLIALYMAADDDPLFLQIKEATASVLEPYVFPTDRTVLAIPEAQYPQSILFHARNATPLPRFAVKAPRTLTPDRGAS
jgi:hypothetical protein